MQGTRLEFLSTPGAAETMKTHKTSLFHIFSHRALSCSTVPLAVGTFLSGMLLGPTAAQAQVTLHADLSDEAVERLEETEAVDAETLYELLSEHLRLSYEGDEPVMSRLVVFFATSEGSLQGSLSSDAFELKPGAEARGAAIPKREFLSLYGESAFSTYGTGSFMIALDPVSASDIAYEFEDAWREGDTWRPEYENAWSQAFSDGIIGANTKGARSAVGVALVPIIGRYTVENVAEIKVRYVAVMRPYQGGQ